jgi:transcription termination factor NusB
VAIEPVIQSEPALIQIEEMEPSRVQTNPTPMSIKDVKKEFKLDDDQEQLNLEKTNSVSAVVKDSARNDSIISSTLQKEGGSNYSKLDSILQKREEEIKIKRITPRKLNALKS